MNEFQVAVTALIAGSILTLVGISVAWWAGLIGKNTRDDARKWRHEDEERRAAEAAEAAEVRRREQLARQYDVDLRDAINVINELQDVACLVITGVTILDNNAMAENKVAALAYKAGQIGARLPSDLRPLMDGDGSVADRAELLLGKAFQPEGESPWLHAHAGIEQYQAAVELDTALGLARNKLRRVLGQVPEPATTQSHAAEETLK